MKKLLIISTFILIAHSAAFAQSRKIESVYTDLASEKCRTIELNSDEGGSYRGECKGADGYKLEVIEGDLRQTMTIVAPNGRKYPLELWTKVSSAFSAVGDKAEWRVVKTGKTVRPFALIFRFNTSDNVEKPEQNNSNLVVVKITKNSACVTDVVKPAANANEQARKLADAAANKPCFALE